MSFLMSFILTSVFWLIGMGVSSFTLIPVLIILVFGIPTTRKLEKMKVLKENNGIVKGYLITLIILPIVFLATAIVTLLFFPNGIIGFLIGVGMTFLFGLGQIGKNKNNVTDYVETNKRHFATGLEEATLAIMQP